MNIELKRPSILGAWVGDQFSHVMKWLRDGPPSVWATFYIVMIPVMGSVFFALPAGSFYDSNLTREPDFKNDLFSVASPLTAAIQRQEYGDGTPHVFFLHHNGRGLVSR